MALRAISVLALVVFAWASPAEIRGESIGLTFDSDCQTCSMRSVPGQAFTLYVVLRNGGRGLLYVDLRITGLPFDWQATCTPNPLAAAQGGVGLFGRGTKIFFPTPVNPPACFVLCTCQIVPSSLLATELRVEDRLDEPFPIDCSPTRSPYVWYCPAATLLCNGGCADGGTARVDGTACTTATDPVVWSTLKSFYR